MSRAGQVITVMLGSLNSRNSSRLCSLLWWVCVCVGGGVLQRFKNVSFNCQRPPPPTRHLGMLLKSRCLLLCHGVDSGVRLLEWSCRLPDTAREARVAGIAGRTITARRVTWDPKDSEKQRQPLPFSYESQTQEFSLPRLVLCFQVLSSFLGIHPGDISVSQVGQPRKCFPIGRGVNLHWLQN